MTSCFQGIVVRVLLFIFFAPLLEDLLFYIYACTVCPFESDDIESMSEIAIVTSKKKARVLFSSFFFCSIAMAGP